MTNTKLKLLLNMLFVSLVATPLWGQDQSSEIQVLIFKEATWVQPDRLKLTFDVTAGHRIYKESLAIKTHSGQEISFKNIVIEPLITFEDKYSQKIKEGVEVHFSITADVFSQKEIKDDAYPLILQYQACSEEYCLFPQDFHFSTPLMLKNSSLSLNRLMSESFLLAVIFVFFAGFLTSFTPCIFPMIPLTLAVLVPRGNTLSFTQKLVRSLSYVFGIALTYSLFGLIAASSGMMFGSILGNKYVALGIALFFVLFAISMLGFFELKAPSFVHKLKWLNNSNTFVFGLAAGVIAGPCVGPVLLSILTFISQTGNLQVGFTLMMSFAFGMGLIFVVLGIVGDAFRFLPKSGQWLNFVKYIFALIMFGLSIYYVNPVLTKLELLIYIQGILLFIVLIYIFFYKKSFHSPLHKTTKTLLYGVSAVLTLSLVMTPFFRENLNRLERSGLPEGWSHYDPKTFESLLKNGKPTVIDFYADWCLACKELKANTFNNKDVILTTKEMNLIVIDATQNSDLIEKLKKEHHVLGLPTLIFYDRSGTKQKDLTLNSFENAENFILRLNKLKEFTP